MFGKNPIRKQVKDDGQKLAVQEIFYTVQGEGPFAGTPAVFIRLAGCNLACTFCDSEFESGIDNLVEVDCVVQAALGLFAPVPNLFGNDPLVVLTGGEPMRQNIGPLIEKLILTYGMDVQIESAGTLWVEGLNPASYFGKLSFVCSPKTGKLNTEFQAHCSHYKYIISADDPGSTNDGLPIKSTQGPTDNLLFRPSTLDTVWLQAMDEQDPEKNAANLKEVVHRCMKHGYRLSLQQHKILGLP